MTCNTDILSCDLITLVQLHCRLSSSILTTSWIWHRTWWSHSQHGHGSFQRAGQCWTSPVCSVCACMCV